MTSPRERTLTALLSTVGRGMAAEIPLLLACGRADGGTLAGFRAIPVGEGLQIGRGTPDQGTGQLLLDDALVSGRHAHIGRGSGGFEGTDSSKNGTLVDGRPGTGPGPA